MRFLEIKKSKYVVAKNYCISSICWAFIQHIFIDKQLVVYSQEEGKPCFAALAKFYGINTAP